MVPVIVETAKAKINLALHVLGRREDGYHALDSIVAFAEFGDELKLREAAANHLCCDGPFAAMVPPLESNIIFKTWAVLQDLLQQPLPCVDVTLTKNLPVASGIGGGSADAAAMVRGMLALVGKSATAIDSSTLARVLGADVPVCMQSLACRMQGIGEKINLLDIVLPRAIVLINPRQPCSTAEVFSILGLAPGQIFRGPVDIASAPDWRNDLTEAALQVCPVIAQVLAALRQEQSFTAVRMSGSGATCFGLVASMAQASAAAARLSIKHPDWWVKAASLT